MPKKHYRMQLRVCGGSACLSNHSFQILETLKREIKAHKLENEVEIITAGCHGFCETGPLLSVKPDNVYYNHLTVEDIPHLVEEHFLKGRPVKRLMFIPPEESGAIPRLSEVDFFKKQLLIALRNRGLIDAEKIDDYIGRDGYRALTKALTDMTPDGIIKEIKKSGLRGRGGAGFPTGLKWEMVKASPETPKYLVCNGDEGDPGAYMDRSIIESDPHSILEGMLIGARATGAESGFVYIRNEYPMAVKRIQKAIEQAREYGLLGKDILGTGFHFDLQVVRGAGAFVCGEETSLISSIQGYPGEPHPRPPYPAQSGLWGKPTNINNVETWANIPVIISRGAEWFASIGTPSSKGTKVFSVVGKVKNTGLVEVPMGLTLGEIIFDICGGMDKDRKFKAVQIGGPSGGCIPREGLNLPVDYEQLTEAGAMMGSGGMVVADENTCMVDMAHFFLTFVRDESCGKCTPCREGIPQMLEILTRIKEGRAEMADLDFLENLARVIKDTSLCGLGKTAPNSVLTTLRYFRHEYEDHILKKRCAAGSCTHLVSAACHHTCPIETEVSSYIALIAQGKYQEALAVNRWVNPLPAVCGRVCHHPCETRCRLGEFERPISIRALKRFLTDFERGNGGRPPVQPIPQTGGKAAVIGSGPAGLTAAWELAKNGIKVTVFESEAVPGGMLAWGIPEYRLPHDILAEEIQAIRETGVEIRTQTAIGRDLSLDDLKDQGYQAIFIATGAPVNLKMGIPGENGNGVMDPIAFLKRFNLGHDVRIGKRVVVVGGGNTAIDAARTAWRLGSEVSILYRRTRAEMPAIRDEVEEALREGISLHFLTLPVELRMGNGGPGRIKCVQMKLGDFDASGRRRPLPMDNGAYELEIDTFMPAIGQKPDLSFIGPRSDLNRTKWDTLEVDPETMSTNIPGIFAGGDVVSGPATVLEAMRAGKIAAASIRRYLRGEDFNPRYKTTETRLEVPPVPISIEEEDLQRPEMPKLPVKERVGHFNEVELGLSGDTARREAKRCLRCDLESLRIKGG